MQLAIEEAMLAPAHGDIPVGAVIVHRGQVIGRGHNERELHHDPTAHAEIVAMRRASAYLKDWQLTETALYCTLEPCCMCAGAIVQARIGRVVYGAIDLKAGCAGSIADLLRHPKMTHTIDVDVGLYADKCADLLHQFFKTLRG
ncbi:MAG: tRNA adenosine(34) deaminase TadA [Anaerolineae bacterium]|jgi:tRNA(adenine34) deaminase|nr:tRNA adenosine(34) deaminase TadA [Anaerolineae bacterium]